MHLSSHCDDTMVAKRSTGLVPEKPFWEEAFTSPYSFREVYIQ